MEEFQNNKKFQDTVRTARELFWKHGIKRVSIGEICSEASVSKMTFYKFFKKKEVLAEYILKQMLNGWQYQYEEIMIQDIPFTSKIKLIIDLKQIISKDISEEFIKDEVV